MDNNSNVNKVSLPLIATRGFIMFPYNTASLDIVRDDSEHAVESARNNHDGYIILSSLINSKSDDISFDNVFKVGCLCQITAYRKNPDGSSKITIKGLNKVKISEIVSDLNGGLFVVANTIEDISGDPLKEGALVRTLGNLFQKNSTSFVSMPSTVVASFSKGVSSHYLVNVIAFYLDIDRNTKQAILEADDVNKKMEIVIEKLTYEHQVKELEKEIDLKVKEKIEKGQKEYILREKLRTIKEELGDVADKDSDIEALRNLVNDNPYPENIKNKVLSELKKLELTTTASPEYAMIRNYLDVVLNTPWYQKSNDEYTISHVEDVLNADHYGLEKPKNRILEYLSVKKYTESDKAPILCFVGPPGVGKTSLALSIARALDRNFVKISLGGVHDESEIRGHRRTYIGAMPGKVIQGMKKAKVINPVFVLDEIDKIGQDQYHGDPSSAMLEVLDPEQNNMFIDNYLEEPYDLSNVLFIATANYLGNIPGPLRDRLEIIQLSSYTEVEKLHIAKEHLIVKQLKVHNLTNKKVVFTDDAILHMIRYYTRESGVRELERLVAEICRKVIANHMKSKKRIATLIDIKKVQEFLGKEKFDYTKKEKTDEIGLVNGLAYTDFGGDLIPIEVNYFAGKGNLILTGNLGDVMKESAKIALDFVKANAKKYNIDETMFDKIDIHIHVPEGAVKKDGPSAGVTMTTAIISALSNTPVRNDVAMTGEVTLRGNVLAIGGLKEKSISAHRSGIKTIIIPKENEKDLDEIPSIVKDNVKIVFASKVEDVLNIALVKEVNHVSY